MNSKPIFFAALVVAVAAASVAGQKLKPEEIVAKHLDSIATAEKRAALRSIMAVGDAEVVFVTQKNQSAVGRVVAASAGAKLFFGLNLNAIDYPQEKFSFDGKNSKIAYVRTTERSVLGNFLQSNSSLTQHSIFGGALLTSWTLGTSPGTRAKLSSEGTKKVGGNEVYVLSYSPKGGSDIDITLYFDKETFRHVRTEYKRTSSAGIGLRPEQSSGYDETRLKVTEDYGDFKSENGMTLPHSMTVTYLITGQRGTNEVRWKFAFTEFAFDRSLDDKTFDIDAK
jgi:hypothetical protein